MFQQPTVVNVVQVHGTLILLSFTKTFHTIILAMKFTTLSCVNTNANTSGIVVWSVDGNVLYLSTKHYILLTAVVLFLLIAIFYTLALLFDAVIEKYLTRIMFLRKQWIKFKPFVDAYMDLTRTTVGFGLVYCSWFVWRSH